jgi:YD repeat-containing protein
MNNGLFRAGVLVLSLICTYAASYAQSARESILPAAPDAAALGKYGEIPVSNYTGIPNISIPIYEITEGDIKVPVSISYHAGGIKVEELSSSIGLGWSLNAGGAITRAVQCADDLRNQPYYTTMARFQNGTQGDKDQVAIDVQGGLADSEPDIFFYNFGNYSGKFVLFPDGKYRPVPLNGCRIELDQSAPGERWTITTPEGTRYVFGRATDNSRLAVEYTSTVFNRGSSSSSTSGASSWFLVEIISARNRKVNFYYYATRYWFQGQFASTEYISGNQDGESLCPSRTEETSLTNNIQGVRLKEITFSNGKAEFIPSTADRKDLPQEKSIAGIRVTDNYGQYSNYWQLAQGYFNENAGDVNVTRMRLDSLIETGGSAGIRKTHSFKYDNTGLPSRVSQSIDHWGYYNAAGNTTLIPTFKYAPPFSEVEITYPRANRESNEVVMKAGILTEITYPTGGRTKFDYEANRVVSERLPDPTIDVNYVAELVGDEFFDTEFDINEPGGQVLAQIDLQGDTYSYLENGCILVYLKNTTTGLQYIFGKNFMNFPTTAWYLSNGHYDFRIMWTNAPNCEFHDDVWLGSNVSWKIKNNAPPEKYNKIVGGLRIARITTTEPVSGKDQVKTFSYQKFNAPAESSGSIFNYPNYISELLSEAYSGHYCEYTLVKSTSNYPLLSPAGSFAEYKEVSVTDVAPDGQTLQSRYTYMTSADWGDILDESFPFPPVSSYEWMRGFPKMATVLRKKADGTYEKAEETVSEYTFNIIPSPANPLLPMVVEGLKFGVTRYRVNNGFDYVTTTYEVPYGFPFMTLSTRTVYTTAGTALTERKQFDYNNVAHCQLSQVRTINSAGDSIFTIYDHPHELVAANADPDGTYAAMIAKNQVSPVILEKQFKKTVQTSLVRTNYARFQNAFYLPASIEKKSGAGLQEKRTLFNAYDTYGNILSITGENGLTNAYIWDYNNSLPVAEAVNGSVQESAYNGFEAEGKGNLTFNDAGRSALKSFTGVKSYNLATGGSISKTGMTAANKYIVAYWTDKTTSATVNGTLSVKQGRTVNGWTYFEHTVSGVATITVSGSGYIDELRVHPGAAKMSAFSYSPLQGMSSSTSTDNKVTRYNYDGAGRLLDIRDTDNNILKRFEYRYKTVNQ